MATTVDNPVLSAAKGYIYVAEPGTTAPTPAEIKAFKPTSGSYKTAFSSWTSVGNTSADDLPEFGFDGGDTEVLGSWQNSAIREVMTKAVTDSLSATVLDFNDLNLGLYYGQAAADTSQPKGVFAVTDAPTQGVDKAVLIVVVDGEYNVAFHAPSSSVTRDDSIELANDAFAGMPLKFTFVKMSSANYIYAWICSDFSLNASGS